MAYRESIHEGELKDCFGNSPIFYNIHKGVGYGCKNYRSDVRLVQFFLNAYIRGLDGNGQLLWEDGLFGGQTWSAIKKFQRDRTAETGKGQKLSMHADGCVTSISGRRILSRNTKSVYTILALNMAYNNAFWLHSNFKDIRRDPNMDEELRADLTRMSGLR